MSWSQTVHWFGEHAGVVSVGGVLTLFLSAYTAHVLTKARESLNRIRDYDTVVRKNMQDKCIGLLNVAEEVRAWVPITRKTFARLTTKGVSTEVDEFRFEIVAGITTRMYKVQHAGELAMTFCPPEFASYPIRLTQDLLSLLGLTDDLDSNDEVSTAEASVESSVSATLLLIRAMYNLEMYDTLDPRPLRNAIKYGLTERRRRSYRKSMSDKIISEIGHSRQQKNAGGRQQEDHAVDV